MKKKLLSILASLALCLSLLPMSVLAAQRSEIVVLYTNDIHAYIDNSVGEGNDNGLTCSMVAALKDSRLIPLLTILDTRLRQQE